MALCMDVAVPARDLCIGSEIAPQSRLKVLHQLRLAVEQLAYGQGPASTLSACLQPAADVPYGALPA